MRWKVSILSFWSMTAHIQPLSLFHTHAPSQRSNADYCSFLTIHCAVEIASIRGSARRGNPRLSAPTSPRGHTAAAQPFRPAALAGSLAALNRIAQQHDLPARSSRASSLASPGSTTRGERADSRLGPFADNDDNHDNPAPVALSAAVPATSRSFPRNVLLEVGNAVDLTGEAGSYGLVLW